MKRVQIVGNGRRSLTASPDSDTRRLVDRINRILLSVESDALVISFAIVHAIRGA
jgi:hypothetical protein